jgi:hypothetical protein
MMIVLYKNIHLNNGMEKRKGFFCLYCFFCIIENSICFSLYFFDEEFYTDVKTLNDQENGGVGVVLGRKVGFSFKYNFQFFNKNKNRLLNLI